MSRSSHPKAGRHLQARARIPKAQADTRTLAAAGTYRLNTSGDGAVVTAP